MYKQVKTHCAGLSADTRQVRGSSNTGAVKLGSWTGDTHLETPSDLSFLHETWGLV